MTWSRDTSADAARVQLDVYRRMAASDRLGAALELTRLSRDLITQGIRRRHPDYTDVEVRWAMLRVWLGPDLFVLAYPGAPQLEP